MATLMTDEYLVISIVFGLVIQLVIMLLGLLFGKVLLYQLLLGYI